LAKALHVPLHDWYSCSSSKSLYRYISCALQQHVFRSSFEMWQGWKHLQVCCNSCASPFLQHPMLPACTVLPACMLASMATAIFLSTAGLSYISLLPIQRPFFLIIDRCCRLFCMSAMSAAVPVAA
jgi:hypothetical protein